MPRNNKPMAKKDRLKVKLTIRAGNVEILKMEKTTPGQAIAAINQLSGNRPKTRLKVDVTMLDGTYTPLRKLKNVPPGLAISTINHARAQSPLPSQKSRNGTITPASFKDFIGL